MERKARGGSRTRQQPTHLYLSLLSLQSSTQHHHPRHSVQKQHPSTPRFSRSCLLQDLTGHRRLNADSARRNGQLSPGLLALAQMPAILSRISGASKQSPTQELPQNDVSSPNFRTATGSTSVFVVGSRCTGIGWLAAKNASGATEVIMSENLAPSSRRISTGKIHVAR